MQLCSLSKNNWRTNEWGRRNRWSKGDKRRTLKQINVRIRKAGEKNMARKLLNVNITPTETQM